MNSSETSGLGIRGKSILVVDDDAGQRSLLSHFLEGQGFDILTADSGEEALKALENHSVDMMISDVRMPGMSGLEALRHCRDLKPNLPVLLVTAYADIRDAVVAMKDGAVNYLEKPIDLDELIEAIYRAVEIKSPELLPVSPGNDLPDGIIALSSSMQIVLRDAELVASSQGRVLISGENGVGKEIVADLIHTWSRCSSGPMIKVNCASIPSNLLESELFGHEKGSFTGAINLRIGRFEEAEHGTILLDEIGEMELAIQAKILRVAQDGTYQRVGSNKTRRTNARILASTNKNLELEASEGRFREDLFFRLNVMDIWIPPLRDRKEDIVPLANTFHSEFAGEMAKLSPAVQEILEGYSWPGNVRQLKNAMERASLMSHGGTILPQHLPVRIQKEMISSSNPSILSSQTMPKMNEVERETILKTLQQLDFNRTETAKVLGISRRSLTYKLLSYRNAGFKTEA
ncbi:MAG TPA: sigma-54-dependent Fis family transcriptional regulator [Verrucomicrobiales bacterium]|nr:sigma-54-dependent Fis family transcriptional regulator [Verrucomicrobiales bacterium]HIL68398.1 sigma-54-dependent Fis family transcriptional regulator [Verrucomicrobiota bacterium]